MQTKRAQKIKTFRVIWIHLVLMRGTTSPFCGRRQAACIQIPQMTYLSYREGRGTQGGQQPVSTVVPAGLHLPGVGHHPSGAVAGPYSSCTGSPPQWPQASGRTGQRTPDCGWLQFLQYPGDKQKWVFWKVLCIILMVVRW